ncbi:MAG: biopolymer transporter ExbD [Candidatus Hydrogenedentes bacterium]|nr:biopolymer transporter ExbD [Candidatus Hydrogenedentota bacterium]
MKFGRNPFQEEEHLQLAPLIDIVFITLVFFVTTTAYNTLESEVDITLPTASSAASMERTRGEIFINLRKDGAIVLNNREVTLVELQDILDRVAENFPGGAVIIRGDRDALLGNAVAVLNACRNADIQNVSFAAYTEAPGSAVP